MGDSRLCRERICILTKRSIQHIYFICHDTFYDIMDCIARYWIFIAGVLHTNSGIMMERWMFGKRVLCWVRALLDRRPHSLRLTYDLRYDYDALEMELQRSR